MTHEALEQWMEASAELLGLKIPDECRVGVLENLRRNLAISEALMNFPLADEVEAAPVFSA